MNSAPSLVESSSWVETGFPRPVWQQQQEDQIQQI